MLLQYNYILLVVVLLITVGTVTVVLFYDTVRYKFASLIL